MTAKCMTKFELATLYTVKPQTLLIWIENEQVFDETELIKYKKCKVVTAALVRKIFDSKIGEPEVEKPWTE